MSLMSRHRFPLTKHGYATNTIFSRRFSSRCDCVLRNEPSKVDSFQNNKKKKLKIFPKITLYAAWVSL